MRKAQLLLAAGILTLGLLPACGGSTKTTIPINEEVFYADSVLLADDGTLWSSGYNAYGQLGNGSVGNAEAFGQVPGVTGVQGVASGANHTVAFSNHSTVLTWGYNAQGRLAVDPSSRTYSSTPVPIKMTGSVQGVAAGWMHSLAIVGADRSVYAWGANGDGQLGNNQGNSTSSYSSSPVQVVQGTGNLTNIKKVAAGGSHSLALSNDGKVWAWGRNEYGQVGQHANTAVLAPVAVAGLTGTVNDIAAAGSYSLALLDLPNGPLGTVWGWGFDGYGQLGNGHQTWDLTDTPVEVVKEDGTALTGVTRISAGMAHVLAIVPNADGKGEVWAWGFNEQGQLGTGFKSPRTTSDTSYVAYAVKAVLKTAAGVDLIATSPAGATAIYAFGNQSFAKIGGVWYGWGDNGWGQLGQEVPKHDIGYLLLPVLIKIPGA